MQVPVVVQVESEDRYSAEPLGKAELRVEGASEAEALRKLTASLRQWLESAKLVQLDVPLESESVTNPWLETFGRSADDPDFEDFIAEIERARASDESG